MISYLKKMNPALPALMATILIYGVLVELIGIWFVEDKIRYTTGLLIGIGLALFLSISIATSIFDVLDEPGVDPAEAAFSHRAGNSSAARVPAAGRDGRWRSGLPAPGRGGA